MAVNRNILKHMRPAGRISRLDLLATEWLQSGEITPSQYAHMVARNNRLRYAKNVSIHAERLTTFNNN